MSQRIEGPSIGAGAAPRAEASADLSALLSAPPNAPPRRRPKPRAKKLNPHRPRLDATSVVAPRAEAMPPSQAANPRP